MTKKCNKYSDKYAVVVLLIKPLSPKSDQHQIFPCNFNTL